jgi:hypothetical protein
MIPYPANYCKRNNSETNTLLVTVNPKHLQNTKGRHKKKKKEDLRNNL